MAEIIVSVRDQGNYRDGDVICAFSDKRIERVNQEHICSKKLQARGDHGYLPINSLPYKLLHKTKQYWFVRQNKDTVRRYTLADMTFEDFTKPDIDVEYYLFRRRKHAQNLVFGVEGSEEWFGGRTLTDRPALNRCWDFIEADTPEGRDDALCKLWPYGRLDVRHFLPMRVDRMTDKQADDWVEPQYFDNRDDKIRWEREDRNQNIIVGYADDHITPPDNKQGWEPKVARKRRQRIDWKARIAADMGETESRAKDVHIAIGDSVVQNGRPRCKSIDQTEQLDTRVNKKAKRRDGN